MDDVEALTTIVNILKQLDEDVRRRVLSSVHTFLDIEPANGNIARSSAPTPGQSAFPPPAEFAKDRSLSPKEFIRDKKPASDVERVACLAYFLSRYRETPHFKTIDISAINTEAAQPKFSNTSFAVENASKQGYLVAALKGSKQISAAGEHFVELLPDRLAAKDAMATYRRKRLSRKSSK
jgi:hypothetical protein